MKTNKSFWTVVVLCALASRVFASPPYVNYQGLLNGANGQPLPTGNYTMEFNIYSQAQGGVPVWGPFLLDGNVGAGHGPVVPVANGHFNVIIGPIDTGSNLIATAFGEANRFVEMRVNGGNPILPRQQFLSNPYAFAVSNPRYELSAVSLTVKSNNVVVFGDATAPAANGAIQSVTTNLTILGAGTDPNSRKIALQGDVLIGGATTPGPSLVVSGDSVVNGNFTSTSNALVAGTLYAAALSDGNRSLSIANVIREDPPMIVDIISLGETTTWQLRQIDLQQHCDDEDGCTIRVYMQHELGNEGYDVRFVEQKIILERPGFSNNPNTSVVKGRGLQIASDEAHIWGRRFTLGDTSREILWEAWDWIWASDYRQGLRLPGGSDSDPETGNNKFKIWISVHPHVSVRIMVYDR
jgi:hypothetical protein